MTNTPASKPRDLSEIAGEIAVHRRERGIFALTIADKVVAGQDVPNPLIDQYVEQDEIMQRLRVEFVEAIEAAREVQS